MPEMIENLMVVDCQWPIVRGDTGTVNILNGPGFVKMGTGIFVSEEDAFDYALEQCFEVVSKNVRDLKWTDEFKEMLVEWFYSDGWIKEG